MTRVVNIKTDAYDVYIGRGSKWGNPYSHSTATSATHIVDTRKEAIAMYRDYVMSRPDLLSVIVAELDGKVLGCFCKPKSCHGDVLIDIIREMKTSSIW